MNTETLLFVMNETGRGGGGGDRGGASMNPIIAMSRELKEQIKYNDQAVKICFKNIVLPQRHILKKQSFRILSSEFSLCWFLVFMRQPEIYI